MLVVLPEPFTPMTRITVRGDCLAKCSGVGFPSSLTSSSRSACCTWLPVRICSSATRWRNRSINHIVVLGPTSALINASSNSSHKSSVISFCRKDSPIRPKSLRVRLKLFLKGLRFCSDVESPPARSEATAGWLWCACCCCCCSSRCCCCCSSCCRFCCRPKNRLSTSAMTPLSCRYQEKAKGKGFAFCLSTHVHRSRHLKTYVRLPRYE